jgi:hypothetical protein
MQPGSARGRWWRLSVFSWYGGKMKSRLNLLVVLFFLLAACGEAITPVVETPYPPISPTFSITATEISTATPEATLQPTVTLTPTALVPPVPPYYPGLPLTEGDFPLAAKEGEPDPFDAIVADLRTKPSLLKSDAPAAYISEIVKSPNGAAHIVLNCPPGSCAIAAVTRKNLTEENPISLFWNS